MGRDWHKLLASYTKKSISYPNPNVLFCPSDRTAFIKSESISYAYSMSFYHSHELINSMNNKSFTHDTLKIKQFKKSG